MAGRAHVVVIGNEKGGSGKTTVAMHLAVGLLRLGFRVGCVDLDHRQQSLGRYVANRLDWIERSGVDLPMPQMAMIRPSESNLKTESVAEEEGALDAALAELAQGGADFIIIDCPGADAPLARHAHTHADTLITPINDSLLDLDLLGQLDPVTRQLKRAGVYSNLVWELRQERRKLHKSGIDWVVTRSRLSALADRNKQMMADVLPQMQRVLGFRLAEGFGERVIYRYMFLWGLTVLDVAQAGIGMEVTKSHHSAREEVCSLLANLWLPRVSERLDRLGPTGA
ncbi:ATPase [Paramagnetospirillum kuznetsovii]|uniref:ATPase n=1 Tax=Paramagnetospirillum kuznetsovii TaxID=2053833 RepID=A0A364NZ84_9PROT|nr:division plane positioning ATPase MipZ [Paramagnetospirillum kuznetsovii]RAU22389.1 ATPase [Paramagnetospirillum kuznetsovii]